MYNETNAISLQFVQTLRYKFKNNLLNFTKNYLSYEKILRKNVEYAKLRSSWNSSVWRILKEMQAEYYVPQFQNKSLNNILACSAPLLDFITIYIGRLFSSLSLHDVLLVHNLLMK